MCGRCGSLELWRPRCYFTDTPEGLERKSEYCALCLLLHRSTQGKALLEYPVVEFSRIGSAIACSTLPDQPIASLYTTPKFERVLPGIQQGLPILSEPGSELNIRIISAWVRDCDQNHTCRSRNDTFLPTRIIDVGNNLSKTVRLVCIAEEHNISARYLALSHRWGSPTLHKTFRTLKSNLDIFKKGIEIATLPKTFQQAIQIAQSLNIGYLWIDSLCIVQDDSEDWNHESELMEQVFSSAYITIAATCASGTDDGFLKERPERQYIQMTNVNASYFVCEAIDNFYLDVDQAELNKRGWVLQERALSRRSIHFTDRQCYWECGGGVRCETLTMMKK